MKRHELVNMQTGEIVPAITWVRRRWKGESFVMVFQEAFTALAKDKELTLDSRRVLDFLFSKLDFENYILIPQVEIASELGMRKQHVCRAIKLLVRKEIILEGPKVDRSHSYRINHFWGWKGTLNNLRVLRSVEAKR